MDCLAVRDAGEGGAGARGVGGRVRAGGLSAAAGPHRPRPQPAPPLPPLTLPRIPARLLLGHPAQVDIMTDYTILQYLQIFTDIEINPDMTTAVYLYRNQSLNRFMII